MAILNNNCNNNRNYNNNLCNSGNSNSTLTPTRQSSCTLTADKRGLMQNIYELGFVLTEVNLYLDTHPDDLEAIEYYAQIKDKYCEIGILSFEVIEGIIAEPFVQKYIDFF